MLRRKTLISLSLAGLFVLSGGASFAQAVQQHSAVVAAASDAVEAIDMEWTDAARQRQIPARLYWPTSIKTEPAKTPLVVFSHGLGGSRLGYSYLGRYLAEQGYAVLHLQHAGSDRAVWTSGIFSMLSNLRAAASDANAIARAQDVSFAITRVLADERFAPRIDASAIAVAGHSYGANTAMLVTGAVVEREGKVMSFKDERIKAAIIMSAPPFYGDADMRQILKPINVPTLHITGTEDIIKVPGYYSDARDRIAVFDAISAPNKALAVFTGATHSIFTDRMAAAPELSAKVKSATRELAATFLNATLRGAPQTGVGDWLAGHKDMLSRGDAPVGQ